MKKSDLKVGMKIRPDYDCNTYEILFISTQGVLLKLTESDFECYIDNDELSSFSRARPKSVTFYKYYYTHPDDIEYLFETSYTTKSFEDFKELHNYMSNVMLGHTESVTILTEE
jgi:hypothetical protein